MQLPFDIQQNVIPAFVTNVGRFMLPNAAHINPGLIQAIRQRRDESTGQMRSNVGGWHSHDDLFDWPEAEAVELKDSVRSAVMPPWPFGKKSKGFGNSWRTSSNEQNLGGQTRRAFGTQWGWEDHHLPGFGGERGGLRLFRLGHNPEGPGQGNPRA